MKIKALKVSEVNNYISRIINNDALLYNIMIEGEVSNCKYHNNGHVYLSLKDDKSIIRGIVFNQSLDNIDFKIENGMNIVASGYIDIYKRDGVYQIVINKAEIAGKGKIYEEFERLKSKLQEEGLFDSEKKKIIPKYPSKIGILTSSTGAAIRDLIANIRRRNDLVDLIVYPSLVQGEKSIESIELGIKKLDELDLDLIIIARGGGSIEDLYSFNSELIARTIYKAKTPIISAIGHETDFTISDFVSDKRASTPSTAAEIAVEDLKIQKTFLRNLFISLSNNMNSILSDYSFKLMQKKNILEYNRVDKKLLDYERDLEKIYEDLNLNICKILNKKSNELNAKGIEIDLLSPMRTLSRGYSIVRDREDNIIKSSKDLKIEDDIKIVFSDGFIRASVKEVKD